MNSISQTLLRHCAWKLFFSFRDRIFPSSLTASKSIMIFLLFLFFRVSLSHPNHFLYFRKIIFKNIFFFLWQWQHSGFLRTLIYKSIPYEVYFYYYIFFSQIGKTLLFIAAVDFFLQSNTRSDEVRRCNSYKSLALPKRK